LLLLLLLLVVVVFVEVAATAADGVVCVIPFFLICTSFLFTKNMKDNTATETLIVMGIHTVMSMGVRVMK